jgi:hypothetical protein
LRISFSVKKGAVAFCDSPFSGLATSKAGTAVNWPAVGWLERHLGFFATFSAYCCVHFSVATGPFTALTEPAIVATAGFVGKTFLCVKLLFPRGENKFHSTIAALQGLVGVAH